MLFEEIKNIKSSRRDLRNFGLSVGIVLILIGLLLWYYARAVYPYFLGIGAGLILLGLAAPAVLKPLQKVWMALAVMLGFVMTRLILSLLFFLIFTPMRFIVFLTGRKLLDLKIDKNSSSYWLSREERVYNREDCEKQF